MKEILPKRRSLRIQRIDPQGAPLPPLPEPEPVVEEHVSGHRGNCLIHSCIGQHSVRI